MLRRLRYEGDGNCSKAVGRAHEHPAILAVMDNGVGWYAPLWASIAGNAKDGLHRLPRAHDDIAETDLRYSGDRLRRRIDGTPDANKASLKPKTRQRNFNVCLSGSLPIT